MPARKFQESNRDFEAIYNAVTSTAQGRWFIEEHARRNRHADTVEILAAIERYSASQSLALETLSAPASGHVVEELAELLEMVGQFREAFKKEPASAGNQISQFVDELEHHLLRVRDFLGITDNPFVPAQKGGRGDILAKLPPELADEAALLEGFELNRGPASSIDAAEPIAPNDGSSSTQKA